MEYLFPHLDEFILDFDAEEASLLHAHMLSAGQVQAGFFAGPGLGSYPVRRVQKLQNASLKTRGRQQPQVGGGGGPAAEPVLDSQLDALRREIARLEQQKQKQGTVRAASSGSDAAGNGGVRRAQKVANATTMPKPAGTANAGAAAPQRSPAAAQRDPAGKRSRLAPGPAQAGAAPASGAAATRPGTAGNAAALRGPTQPAASGPTPASSQQSPAATGSTAVPAQQRVCSKRPADEGPDGAAAQQHRPLPKRQPPQRRPQQLEQPPVELQLPEASELGPDTASARQAQPAGRRAVEPPQQHASPAAAAQLSGGDQEGHRACDGENGSEPAAGATRALAGAVQCQGQQAPGTSSAPGHQQPPSSQAGPGPPRKRPRIAGQRPAASTSGPTAGAGRSPGSQQAAAAGVATVQTASNSSASTQDGSPAVMLGPGKRARPGVGSPGGCPPGLGAAGVDEGAAGHGVDEGHGASDRREPAGPAHGRPATSDMGAAHISPEAELAATAFLVSFMTQISGEGQDRDRGTATAGALQQQQRQDAGAAPMPPAAAAQTNGGVEPLQQVQQQRHPQGGNPAPSCRAAELAPGVAGQELQGCPGDGCTQGGPLAVGGRGALSPGSGGGALARRAAAERTSAAVQRLRRKSSGAVAPDPLLRPVRSTGATGTAARATSADAAADTATAGVVVAAAGGCGPGAGGITRSPPAGAGGEQHMAPSAAVGCARPGRNGDDTSAPPSPLRFAHQPAVGTHPQPVAAGAPGGGVADGGDGAPAASTVGRSPVRTLGAAGLIADVAPAARPYAVGAAATEPAAAEADASQDLFGAVSSPVAARQSAGAAQGVGGSPGAAGSGEAAVRLGGGSSHAGPGAHVPPWGQAYAGGAGGGADRARTGPALAPGDALQQREPPSLDRSLGFGPQGHPTGAAAGLTPGGISDAAALHASGLATGAGLGSASVAAAAAAASEPAGAPPPTSGGYSQPQPSNALHPPGPPSALLFRPGGPFGMCSPMGHPQLPFPQLGLPPHMLLGGPFPGAFPPGPPPPGMQWRSGPASGIPLGAGQPVVSLVEVDVIARKELLLLKWNMLQEIASDLEAEWVEACHAHNRLRHLSMAQAQPGSRPTAPPPAGDPTCTADAAAATQVAVVPRRAEDVPPAPYLHLAPHEHPPPHALGLLLQQQAHLHPEQQAHYHPPRPQQQMQLQQQSQPRQQDQQQQQEQQQGMRAVTSLQQAAAPQPFLAHLSAPRPPAAQDEGGAHTATEAHHAAPATTGLRSAHEVPPGLQTLQPSLAARPSSPEHPAGQQLTRPQHHHHHHHHHQQHPDRERQAADATMASAPEHDGGPAPETGSWREQRSTEVGAVPVLHGPPARQQQQQGAAASGAGGGDGPTGAGGGAAVGLESRGGPQRSSGDGAARLPLPRQPALVPTTLVSPTVVQTTAGAAAAAAGAMSRVTDGAIAGVAGAGAPEAEDRQPDGEAVERRNGDSADGRASASAGAGAGRVGADNLSLQPVHSGACAAAQQLHVPPAARVDARHDGGTAATPCAAGGGEQVAGVAAPSAAERQAAAALEVAAAEEAALAASASPQPSQPRPGTSDGGGGRGGSGFGGWSVGEDGGSHPSTRQQAHVWTPWEDASAADGGPAAHASAAEVPQSNGVVTLGSQAAVETCSGDGGGATSSGPASAGWGDGGEGDSGRGVGTSDAAPFTGLRFKLAMAPVAGRRVAAMRARSGTLQASPVKTAAPGTATKRVVAPPVSAIVAATSVRPGLRGSPVVAIGAGAAAPADVAAAAAASAPVAAPAEPPLRVQSAPQVPPATRARGGSRSPGDAAAASMQPQEQQAPQALVSRSSNSSGAGVREEAAALAHPATQTAPHVQAPPAARGAAAPTDGPGFPHPARHGTQQAQHALPSQPGQDPQQQAQQSPCVASMTLQEQEQRRPVALPQLASPHAPSPPLLYQARRDFVLTARGAAAAPGLPATLVEVLSSKYTSPLSIFRSYSVGSPR